MREIDFVQRFSKELEVHKENSSYINPLEVFESYYFNRKNNGMGYRDEALNRCIEERVNFSSTENNERNIMSKFIKITCPECNESMNYHSNLEYKCVCGNKVKLHFDFFETVFSRESWYNVIALKAYKDKEDRVIVPIKASYNKDDEVGHIVAHVIRHNRKMGDKYIVSVDYLNIRAMNEELADKVIMETFEALKNGE